MATAEDDGIEDPVSCVECGTEYFELVKVFSNDSVIVRVLRCTNGGHLRTDIESLKP